MSDEIVSYEQLLQSLLITNKAYKELKAENEKLRDELEKERMRLAACGVIAMSNTEDSLYKALEMHPDYYCASVKDVERAVRQEIKLREALEHYQSAHYTFSGEKCDHDQTARQALGIK